jgi:hypothetical protein
MDLADGSDSESEKEPAAKKTRTSPPDSQGDEVEEHLSLQ